MGLNPDIIDPAITCQSCYHPVVEHGDSGAGSRTICPPKDLMGALEASLVRAGIGRD